MVMVRYKDPATRIEGKSGGNVYRYDWCKQHIQSMPRKIKKRTPDQDKIRSGFTDMHTTFYKRLSWQDRAAWAVYGHKGTYKNKKGEPIHGTGFIAFFRYNVRAFHLGLPPRWLPPMFKQDQDMQDFLADWDLGKYWGP